MMMRNVQVARAPCSSSAARRAASAAPALPAQRRALTVARADPKEVPESVQEDSGFVAYDSAGQSNMYPVYTKAYAAAKPDANSNATNLAALAGAAVAGGAIALGLVLGGAGGGAGNGAVDLSQYRTLTEYAALFESGK